MLIFKITSPTNSQDGSFFNVYQIKIGCSCLIYYLKTENSRRVVESRLVCMDLNDFQNLPYINNCLYCIGYVFLLFYFYLSFNKPVIISGNFFQQLQGSPNFLLPVRPRVTDKHGRDVSFEQGLTH